MTLIRHGSGLLLVLTLLSGCRDQVQTQTSPPPHAKLDPKAEPGSALAIHNESATETPKAEDATDQIPIRGDGTVFADATLMGTTFSINIWLGDHSRANEAGEAIRAAMYEVARLESLMSEWKPESSLSQLNRDGELRSAPPELLEVLLKSRKVSQATDGRFDVTFHSFGKLWSFKPGSQPPKPEAIENVLQHVGWQKVAIQEEQNTISVPSGTKIGLGAIAKGYAVDAASKLLNDKGFPNHIVDGGGDTYTAGTKNGSPWKVGIKNPDAGSTPDAIPTLAVLPTSNQAVVTSGTYERFIEYEGVQYAHLLDPRTGWPIAAEKSPVSVTVVAPTATDADAYCTALSLMAPPEALRYVEKKKNLEIVIVTRTGVLLVSSGLEGRLQRNKHN